MTADARPIPVHKVENPGRNPRIMAEFREQHRRQRRLFGWFQHTSAASQQRRNHLQCHLIHWPIPRCYQADHPNRFQRDPVIWGVGAQRADPFHGLKRLQEILQMPGQAGRLISQRHVNRRAHFKADRPRHFIGAAFKLPKDPFDKPRAGVGRRHRPRLECDLGRGDGGVRIGLPTKADHGARVFGRGVDDRAIAGNCGGNPTTIDIKIAFHQHGIALCWMCNRATLPHIEQVCPRHGLIKFRQLGGTLAGC